jgi:hypothetical protein
VFLDLELIKKIWLIIVYRGGQMAAASNKTNRAFNQSKHPRNALGQFVSTSGTTSKRKKKKTLASTASNG